MKNNNIEENYSLKLARLS